MPLNGTEFNGIEVITERSYRNSVRVVLQLVIIFVKFCTSICTIFNIIQYLLILRCIIQYLIHYSDI